MIKDSSFAKNLWYEVADDESLNIYINIPFCMCQCRYCLYKGNMNAAQQTKKDFVYGYLIPTIQSFHDVFERHEINTIYFGGGTPNAVSPEMISDICDATGCFDRAHSRIIEINPAFCNEEYVEAICQQGFTLLTFGVQSFDKESLQLQKRPYCSAEKIKMFGNICAKHNILYSIDIMCYLKTYTAKDLEVFKSDIELAKFTEADFVTVYPELNLILNDEKARAGYVQTIQELDLGGYYLDDETLEVDRNPRSITRLIKKKYPYDVFLDTILPYYENDFPYAVQNIIGFGDMSCRQEIVSYSPRRFFYAEKNLNGVAMFDIRYDKEPLR